MTFFDDLCHRHRAWAVDRTEIEEVPRGWHALVAQLFEAIAAVMAEQPGQRLAVWQVRQKRGILRADHGPAGDREGARSSVADAVHALVAEAETRSVQVCDRCGAPGRLRKGAGIYATRCDGCAVPGSALHPDPAGGKVEDAGTDGTTFDRDGTTAYGAAALSCLATGAASPGVVAAATALPDDDEGFMGDADPGLDGWGNPDNEATRDEAAAVSVPGHRVMDRAAIRAALRASGYNGSFEAMSSGEEQRARMLVQYRDADLFRPHLIGSDAMLAHLDALDGAAPNFAAVTRLLRRAARVSSVAGTPLRIPPTVLLGTPGIGKSRYARLLADALGTSCDIVDGATLPDVGSLTGYPPVWRGSGPGYLAKMLLSAKTSAPLVFVDEAEKIIDYEQMLYPLDRLLPILERDTARTYKDECLQVPMQAQHAVLLFAVNSLDGLSEPFRDRVLTIRIPDLSAAQRDAVLAAMLAEVGRDLGLPVSLAGPEALAPLRDLSTRRCRLALEIAVGHAAEGERRVLLATDLAEAVALLARPDRPRAPVGFFPQHAAERD